MQIINTYLVRPPAQTREVNIDHIGPVGDPHAGLRMSAASGISRLATALIDASIPYPFILQHFFYNNLSHFWQVIATAPSTASFSLFLEITTDLHIVVLFHSDLSNANMLGTRYLSFKFCSSLVDKRTQYL